MSSRFFLVFVFVRGGGTMVPYIILFLGLVILCNIHTNLLGSTTKKFYSDVI